MGEVKPFKRKKKWIPEPYDVLRFLVKLAEWSLLIAIGLMIATPILDSHPEWDWGFKLSFMTGLFFVSQPAVRYYFKDEKP